MSNIIEFNPKHEIVSIDCVEKKEILRRFFKVDFFYISLVTDDEGEGIGYHGIIGSMNMNRISKPVAEACNVFDSMHRQTVFDSPDSLICVFLDCLMEQGVFAEETRKDKA